MRKMLQHTRSLGLLLLALLVGLLLPEFVSRAQDVGPMVETAEIEPVALSEDSGLQNAEKINILADESCKMTALSAGKHQGAESLSSAVWLFLEQISYYNLEPQILLDTATAEQKTHGAWLVTLDTQAFIVWEVLFADDLGNQLRVYIDDESTIPLGMAYTAVKPVSLDHMQIDTVLEIVGSMNGLYTVDVTQYNSTDDEAAIKKEKATAQAVQEMDMAAPLEETLFFTITLGNADSGEVQCTIPLELDSNGFRINWVR